MPDEVTVPMSKPLLQEFVFHSDEKDNDDRMKFRSQTSDNMDRWKSRGAKSQRREEQKREDQRREKLRRKKTQAREKVEKSRFTVFFQWCVAPEGQKVGSLKRRVRSHLARGEMKNCTPLWCEAHFQAKMRKTHRSRTTFGNGEAQYKRHVRQSCSEVRALIPWERLHFGASDLQVCWDDFAWQVQHFVWLGITFTWQAQYFRQMEWKNSKTHWHEAVSSALNFPLLKEVPQNCFAFDVANFKICGSLAGLLRFWHYQVQKLRKSRRIASFSNLQIDRDR